MTRANKEEVRRLQRAKKKLLRIKKREHEHCTVAEIEEMQSANESRKFFVAIKNTKKAFHPRVAMCRSKEGEPICSRDGVLDRWKQHFDELLNDNLTKPQYASTRTY